MDIYSLLDNGIFLNLLSLTILYWANLAYPKIKLFSTLTYYSLVLVNILLVALLSLRWLTFGYFPLSNLYESLCFLAWGIVALTLLIENQSQMKVVGAITIPIAMFVTGLATLSLPETMQAPVPLVPALKSNWLMMHVTVMMVSYASLITGSLLGVFFLILSKLKRQQFEPHINLDENTRLKDPVTNTVFFKTEVANYSPNLLIVDQQAVNSTTEPRLSLLESIDNLSYRIISFGFPLLTIGIIAGAIWANEAWGSYWSWDPKETWALITWLVFASYLHARLTKEWEGEKPAMIASLGFLVIWICYLGVNFLGKGLHTYGQIF